MKKIVVIQNYNIIEFVYSHLSEWLLIKLEIALEAQTIDGIWKGSNYQGLP